jgi:CHAD domain-containing protein
VEQVSLGEHLQGLIGDRRRRMASREAELEEGHGAERLHHLRVACRRLGSALQLGGGALRLPPRVTPRYLARLARILGRLRDLDVQQALLNEELVPALDTAASAALVATLDAFSEPRRLAWSKVQRALRRPRHRRFAAELDGWLAAPEFTRMASLPLSAVRGDLLLPPVSSLLLHPGWLITVAEATGAGATTIHDLRKTARRTRYLGECLESTFGPEFAAWLGELAGLQDTLGSLHDLVVLRERLRETLGAEHAAPLQEAMHARETAGLQAWEQIRLRYLDPRRRDELRAMILGLSTSVPAPGNPSTTP